VRSDLTVHGTALWVLLSGVAVVLLMGVTNYLCLDVASIPFLWILPLAIYLITLIVCFGAPQLYWRLPFVLLAAIAYLAQDAVQYFGVGNQLVALAGGLLAWDDRAVRHPAVRAVHAAARGAVPAASAAALADRRSTCARRAAARSAACSSDSSRRACSTTSASTRSARRVVSLVLPRRGSTRPAGSVRAMRSGGSAPARAPCARCSGYRGSEMFDTPANQLHQERSFFGVLRVEIKRNAQQMVYRSLMHGSTMHGAQFEGAAARQGHHLLRLHTGVELALGMRDPNVPTEIGVVGLGTGTIAAYGRPAITSATSRSIPR
jgi:hypothetical protein